MHLRAYAWVCAWEFLFVFGTGFIALFEAGEGSFLWAPVAITLLALPSMLIAWVLGFAALVMLPAPFTRGIWVTVNFFRTLILAIPIVLLANSLGSVSLGIIWTALCFGVSTPLYSWLRNRIGQARIPPQAAG